jgi:3-oxoacyl-[acyl-carrier protein] reductase
LNLGLDGRVALVTAGSRGLGRATAEALAAEGASLVVVARDAAALEDLARPFGDRCRVVAGDLTDPQLPPRAVDTALAAFGRLDIVVANTGGPPAKLPLEIVDEDFARAFETTFYPAVRLIRAAARPLCERGWGRIVIVSSTSIKAPKPFLALSAAARSALWAWAKSLAPELFARGVTLNVVCPGPHATARAVELGVRPGQPMGKPEDFARLVITLCADAAAFITGTSLIVDGGELRAL